MAGNTPFNPFAKGNFEPIGEGSVLPLGANDLPALPKDRPSNEKIALFNASFNTTPMPGFQDEGAAQVSDASLHLSSFEGKGASSADRKDDSLLQDAYNYGKHLSMQHTQVEQDSAQIIETVQSGKVPSSEQLLKFQENTLKLSYMSDTGAKVAGSLTTAINTVTRGS